MFCLCMLQLGVDTGVSPGESFCLSGSFTRAKMLVLDLCFSVSRSWDLCVGVDWEVGLE